MNNAQRTLVALGIIATLLIVALFSVQFLSNGAQYAAIMGILLLACAGAGRPLIFLLTRG